MPRARHVSISALGGRGNSVASAAILLTRELAATAEGGGPRALSALPDRGTWWAPTSCGGWPHEVLKCKMWMHLMLINANAMQNEIAPAAWPSCARQTRKVTAASLPRSAALACASLACRARRPQDETGVAVAFFRDQDGARFENTVRWGLYLLLRWRQEAKYKKMPCYVLYFVHFVHPFRMITSCDGNFCQVYILYMPPMVHTWSRTDPRLKTSGGKVNYQDII